jgi:hypothetical protein
VRDELVAVGYTVPPTQSNFVWVCAGRAHDGVRHPCLEHKIVVRPFATDGCRVTVSTPEETTSSCRLRGSSPLLTARRSQPTARSPARAPPVAAGTATASVSQS